MSNENFQKAIHKLSTDHDYQKSVNAEPGRLQKDFELSKKQMTALYTAVIATGSLTADKAFASLCLCCVS